MGNKECKFCHYNDSCHWVLKLATMFSSCQGKNFRKKNVKGKIE